MLFLDGDSKISTSAVSCSLCRQAKDYYLHAHVLRVSVLNSVWSISCSVCWLPFLASNEVDIRILQIWLPEKLCSFWVATLKSVNGLKISDPHAYVLCVSVSNSFVNILCSCSGFFFFLKLSSATWILKDIVVFLCSFSVVVTSNSSATSLCSLCHLAQNILKIVSLSKWILP